MGQQVQSRAEKWGECIGTGLLKGNGKLGKAFLRACSLGFPKTIKNLPTMQETWVRYLGWEDALENEMATYTSIFVWETPWTKKPGGLQSMGSQRVGHDWVTKTFTLKTCIGAVIKESTCQCRRHKRCWFDPWVAKITWRRKWQPTPVFLPEESHRQRTLSGCSPWGRKDSDTTERLSPHTHDEVRV